MVDLDDEESLHNALKYISLKQLLDGVVTHCLGLQSVEHIT
jgi:hypothetical protein